ncbi:hypothetical protein PG985_007245 [Apiospora marii]|uniref:Uncharacterized protein n=1 Tax=Apiospora marii TaxID=335849 RepID=A0ABR1SET3_9PEZI
MRFAAIFLWAVTFTTAYTQENHTPDTVDGSLLSGVKSDCVMPTNSTTHDGSKSHDNSTAHGNSTTDTKSKGSAGNTSLGTGSKVGNSSGGGNSTKPPVKAAGYAIEAADAGGLVTLAGLGVAFALYM